MTQPCALVLYEKLLPGTQLVNRLQDLKYRVQSLAEAKLLVQCAEQTKPMLVLADLQSTRNDVLPEITRLRHHEATRHIPVIAFGAEEEGERQEALRAAGVTLFASESAILNHLPQLLQQALQVD